MDRVYAWKKKVGTTKPTIWSARYFPVMPSDASTKKPNQAKIKTKWLTLHNNSPPKLGPDAKASIASACTAFSPVEAAAVPLKSMSLLKTKSSMLRDLLESPTVTTAEEILTPLPPAGPLDVSKVTYETCVLHWQPPAYPRGAPLKFYVTEFSTDGGDHWSPAGISMNTKKIIKDLKEATDYLFRVKAVNEKGFSQPLITTTVIRTKDPKASPSRPSKPTITYYDQQRVTIAWARPDRSGSTPLKGYELQKRQRGTTFWESIANTDENTTQLTFNGLDRTNEQQFRIIAYNHTCGSDPSYSVSLPPDANGMGIVDQNLDHSIHTIKAHKTTYLEAPMNGRSCHKVVWNFEQTEITNNDEFQIATDRKSSKLTIRDPKRENSGVYRVVVHTVSGIGKTQFHLKVISVPSPPTGPIIIVKTDQYGCEIEWKQPLDDGGLPLDGFRIERLELFDNRWVSAMVEFPPTMTRRNIPGLQQGLFYKFRVFAINSEGYSEPLETENFFRFEPMVTSKIDPILPPQITDYPSEVPIHIGETESFEIKYKGTMAHDIFITQNGEAVGVPKRFSYTIENGKVKIQLSETQEKDDGMYEITLSNPAGQDRITIKITITGPFGQPTIEKPLQNRIELVLGQTLDLKINFNALPKAKVLWYHNHEQITDYDQRYRVTNEWNHTRLISEDVTYDIEGEYAIWVENKNGFATEVIKVIVLYRPLPPPIPIVEKIDETKVSISWQSPAESIAYEAKGYQIQMRNLNFGLWQVLAELGADTNTFTTNPLTPGTQYQFRLTTFTENGMSEPSVPSQIVELKERLEGTPKKKPKLGSFGRGLAINTTLQLIRAEPSLNVIDKNELNSLLYLVETDTTSNEIKTSVENKAHTLTLLKNNFLALAHARQCKRIGYECNFNGCPMIKTLISHVENCTNYQECSFEHCYSSRRIVNHWIECDRVRCGLCLLLKRCMKITDDNFQNDEQFRRDILSQYISSVLKLDESDQLARQITNARRDENESYVKANSLFHYVVLMMEKISELQTKIQPISF